jgi:class 3 adenylate cyclase
MKLDDLIAAGLFDPDAPDADTQRAMLQLAIDAGAGIDEVRLALEEGWLHAIPVQRALIGGMERLTVDEAAARTGFDPALAHQLWSALGLEERGPGDCSERDLAVFAWYAHAIRIWGEAEAMRLARVTGAALARLADAEVAQVRSALEAPLRASGGDNLAVARLYGELVPEVLPGLQETVVRVHAHHLSAAGRRYSLWGNAPTTESTSDLVVGFADLVGFTAMGETLAPEQVDALLRTFEERAYDAATSRRTRLIKFIGDEAMFVTGAASDAIRVARALVDDPDLPPMRVGMAAGEVVARGGDVFGPAVNLAARLVATAAPGEILVDSEFARRSGPETAIASCGTRDLPGFTEPVEIFAIS